MAIGTCVLTIGGYVCFLRARLLKQNSPHYCILISFLFRWPIFLTYENKPLPADIDREHFTRPVLLGKYAAFEHHPSRILDRLQDKPPMQMRTPTIDATGQSRVVQAVPPARPRLP